MQESTPDLFLYTVRPYRPHLRVLVVRPDWQVLLGYLLLQRQRQTLLRRELYDRLLLRCHLNHRLHSNGHVSSVCARTRLVWSIAYLTARARVIADAAVQRNMRNVGVLKMQEMHGLNRCRT
jgi:hypothetical protein